MLFGPGFRGIAGMLFLSLAVIPQWTVRAADTTPPTGKIVINNGRTATNTPNVTLSLSWDDGADGTGVTRMRFSDDGAHWSLWEPAAATLPHTLPNGDGHKTVRVQFMDRANNRSAVYNDYIMLDTTAPAGAIVIDGGVNTTVTQFVTLGLTLLDAGAGVTRMRFSDNGATWTPWELPRAIRPHTLPSGSGYHTVRAQFLDGAGNYSPVYNDYIKLADPIEQTVLLPGGVPMEMVWIGSGSFLMGRCSGELDSFTSEDPQHSVRVNGFWMAKYEVTKRQWQAVMETTPWTGQACVSNDPDSPAVFVSWDDARAFCAAVSSQTGNTFRLPSEAEWEYACRAGTTTRFYWGDDPSYTAIGDYASYDGNCSVEMYAHAVGQKLPNAFGLYDMIGNVWEWCGDWWHDSYTGAPANGGAWEETTGYARVLRGGSWAIHGADCRSARRQDSPWNYQLHCYGFRPAQNP